MTRVWHYESPVGKLGIAEDGNGICALFFAEETLDREQKSAIRKQESWVPEETGLIKRAWIQLQEYFAGERREFDLPLSLHGTDFQLADWAALQTIPYGETCSYSHIAKLIGKEKACRAVGMANHHNPVSIVVPCHRVVGKNGKLVGYGGGLDKKKYLLELEQKNRISGQ